MQISMSCLEEGQWGRIQKLNVTAGLRRRLQDFGLIEGTCVCCLRKSPKGDPVIYRVGRTMLALRTADSSRVFVEKLP